MLLVVLSAQNVFRKDWPPCWTEITGSPFLKENSNPRIPSKSGDCSDVLRHIISRSRQKGANIPQMLDIFFMPYCIIVMSLNRPVFRLSAVFVKTGSLESF